MSKSFSTMMIFASNRYFSIYNIFELYIFKKFKYYINLYLNNWFFINIYHMKNFLRLINLRIIIECLYLLISEYYKRNCKKYINWDQMKYIKINYYLNSEIFSSKLNSNHIFSYIYLNKSSFNSFKLFFKFYSNHSSSYSKYR